MFDSFNKRKKQKTFKYWRFRILHWAYKEKAQTPEESSLPQYFYNKWCPLFWMSNLLALIWPFILGFRVFGGVSVSVYNVVNEYMFLPTADFINWIAEVVGDRMDAKAKVSREAKEAAMKALMSDPKHIRGLAKQIVIQDLSKLDLGSESLLSFQHYWDTHRYKFVRHEWPLFEDDPNGMTALIEMIKDLHEKVVPVLVKAKEEKRRKMAERQAWMTKWIIVSQTVLKFLMNIGFAAIAATFLYLTYTWGVPAAKFIGNGIVSVFHFLTSGDVLSFLAWAGLGLLKIAVLLTAVGAVCYGLFKLKVVNTVADSFGAALRPVGSALGAIGRGFVKGIENFFEFISMFYETNCPELEVLPMDSTEALVEESLED